MTARAALASVRTAAPVVFREEGGRLLAERIKGEHAMCWMSNMTHFSDMFLS